LSNLRLVRMMKNEKTEVIENLYSTFRKYTTSNMHYCDCGCIDLNDVKKLASKKLRDLEEDDFCSYHGSALYTWGDMEHYKHFLPRILEVHNKLNGRGLIGLYELTTKLDYAKWNTWEQQEKKAIKDFIYTDWNDFVNEKESDIGKDDLAYYSFFFELESLVKLWKIDGQGTGLRNFVYFFYYNGTELISKGLEIKDKNYDSLFKEFINQEQLVERLEEAFFKVESENKEYAEKISAVTQMIEQERKRIGNKKI